MRLCVPGLVLFLMCSFCGFAHTMGLNVRDHGAKGDGVSDDTVAFQAAMNTCATSGGTVLVPPGRYAIRGHLEIPEYVTLEGTFKAPPPVAENHGSILFAYEGRGKDEGTPFIFMKRGSCLKGLQIRYPEQGDDIVPYPWTIRGFGDNIALLDLMLVNPYRAIDFGTFPAGRHLIRGVYGHPLKTGLFIDKCFDVGRVEDVHFWPFSGDTKARLDWTRANATAFILGRTDWEYLTNCFAIAYKVGFHFVANADGPGNALLSQCGSDIGPCAVKVDAVQGHAGASFVNGQFMSGLEVAASNTGPLKFTNCGFWGVDGETDTPVWLDGAGHTTFQACHFAWYGQKNVSAPAIVARGGGLTVSGCEFMDSEPGTRHIELRENVEVALIYGNRFRIPPKIENRSEGDVQIAMNSSGKPSRLAQALDEGDGREVARLWRRRLETGDATSYPMQSRLASAITIGDSSGDLRERLLRSIVDEGETVPAQMRSVVRRAADEMALASEAPIKRPTVPALRTNQPPRLDGKLDDAAWQEARFEEFPVSRDPVSTRTRVALLWDREALYLAAQLGETEMGKVQPLRTAHDGQIWLDESLEFFLCPGRTTHRYLQMIINANGVFYDGVGTTTGTNASQWTTNAEVKTAREAGGWTIEMRLTWKDIGARVPSPGDMWSADFRRWRYIGGEQYSSWSSAPLKGLTHWPEAFGFLRFDGAR